MEENKLIERLVSVEERSKSNTKRLDEHDKDISELKRTYSLMETMNLRIGNVETSVESINTKLDENNNKKIEWIDYVLKGILTIVLGYIAIKLGLK